ncbi:Uncharacterised protein [Enterobacter kobei]|nr:Uncharacterised protein [Enterobacter kobei]
MIGFYVIALFIVVVLAVGYFVARLLSFLLDD